jgi:iron(III) transport system ATP-binding protein
MHHGVIQQIATPVDLFDNPANRFVADFVGSINLLPGRVERSIDGISIFDSPMLGRFSIAHVTAAAGPAEIAVRPHTIALGLTANGSKRVWIEGTIAEREFVGEFVRYTVKVKSGTIIADQAHHMGRPTLEPGSTVHVGIDPAQVRLLPIPQL